MSSILSLHAGEALSDGSWNPHCFDYMETSGTTTMESVPENQVAIVTVPNQSQAKAKRAQGSGACLQCRARHIKCDATKPKCNRCTSEDRHCEYVASRRGGQNKKTIGKKRPTQINTSGNLLYLEALAQSNGLNLNPLARTRLRNVTSTTQLPLTPATAPPSPETVRVRREEHINLYYEKFHDAHPYILPKHHFLNLINKSNEGIHQLLLVVLFIGSTHSKDSDSGFFQRQALALLSQSTSHDPHSSCYTVQASLLLSIALHSRDDSTLAQGLLRRASELAISLGMHCREFAVQHAKGDIVVRESWKRTYWGIYCTETMFAAIHRNPLFGLIRLFGNTVNPVDLPGEDSDYKESIILEPSKTLQEFDDRAFSPKEVLFSSFAYLIAICRLAGNALNVTLDFQKYPPGNSHVESVDTKLANWELQLPEEKRQVINHNGGVDELMFQSQSVFHALRIALHRPRSILLYESIENLSHCTQIPSADSTPTQLQKNCNVHTQHAFRASEELLLLFGLPGDVHRHSPLLMCALSMAMAAQLSALVHRFAKDVKASKEMIMLGLNSMLKWGAVSELGVRTRKEMQQIAVFMLGKAGTGDRDDQPKEIEAQGSIDGRLIHSRSTGSATPATPPPETTNEQSFDDPIVANFMEAVSSAQLESGAPPTTGSFSHPYIDPKTLNEPAYWNASMRSEHHPYSFNSYFPATMASQQPMRSTSTGTTRFGNQQHASVHANIAFSQDGLNLSNFGPGGFYSADDPTSGNTLADYGELTFFGPTFNAY